eukprot:COSAG05_NODE_13736_length_419_cov_1.493750_1_plen_99_part_00
MGESGLESGAEPRLDTPILQRGSGSVGRSGAEVVQPIYFQRKLPRRVIGPAPAQRYDFDLDLLATRLVRRIISCRKNNDILVVIYLMRIHHELKLKMH